MSVLGLQMEWTVGPEKGPDALQHLAVAFERAGAEMADLGKHVFPKLGGVFEAAVASQFDAEGEGPVAGAWPALNPGYAAWKERHYPGQPMLVLTGEMRAALTTPASPHSLREWDATNFSYGTTGIHYASFHQTGATRHIDGVRVYMPPRPPFDFGPEFERQITRTAAWGVREAVRSGSGGMLDLEGE